MASADTNAAAAGASTTTRKGRERMLGSARRILPIVEPVADWRAAVPRHSLPADMVGWVLVHRSFVKKRLFLTLAGSVLSATHREDDALAMSDDSCASLPDPVWTLDVRHTYLTSSTTAFIISLTSSAMTTPLALHFDSLEHMRQWSTPLDYAVHAAHFDQFYHPTHIIASSPFSVVTLATEVLTSRHVVARVVPLPHPLPPSSHPADALPFPHLTRIRHPSILPVLHVFHSPTAVHIVTELHSNRFTLDNVLARRHTVPERAAVPLLRRIVDALAHLHAHGLVHRAVHPRNVFCIPHDDYFDADDPPLVDMKLAELALLNCLPDPDARGALRDSMVDQPHYYAPEVVRGDAFGPPMDVWACGAVMFRALCGRPPFGARATSLGETVRAVQRAPLVFDEGRRGGRAPVSLHVRHVLASMLQADPAKRPTAEKVFDMLG